MDNKIFLVDGKKIDVSETIELNRVYRGYDTIDSNKNNYTYTVKFPFTYNNDLVFKRTNSLSYKSDFPYEEHSFDAIDNGINVIRNGKLYLLSTTDSYECSITWGAYDYVKAITEDNRKLGIALASFPFVNWNYKHSEVRDADDYGNASSYGYINYYDAYGNDDDTYFVTNKHPLINFKYLLDYLFSELGITVNIPTAKSDFLNNLIIRPNKEYDININNVFEADMLHKNHSTSIFEDYIYALMFAHIEESSPTIDFGRNSYYFKAWMDIHDGIDDVCPIPSWGNLPQSKRIKCFKKCTGNVLTISDSVLLSGSDPIFTRYRPSDESVTNLYSVTGDGTYTFDAEEGDWFFFGMLAAGVQHFKCTITTPVNSDDLTPTPLYFPSLYHIPTNIDLTVGELVNEALKLTGSKLGYNVNSNSYSFDELTRDNETQYDITDNIISIKEISYSTKYLYNRLGQLNIFKYLSNFDFEWQTNGGVVSTHYELVSNPKLIDELIIVDSKFASSGTLTDSPYTNLANIREHEYVPFELWTKFFECPLHLFWNDTVNSTINFKTPITWESIYNEFYSEWFDSLKSLALSGTPRVLKLICNMSEVEFKRVNPFGIVYIKTYGKFYGIIEITKSGNFTEFFILELY